ncbi:hypothetical protein G1C96_1435 [Bifidobacterium sp. DSM 109958]|uniref:DUF881 domain-containing protein n=1 Tax=Bifidobacterium moraviense TaxID=2675323 RepID=A0A7Y0F2I0_9BIFI|nr:DUF881 domain-containing protein [Bifidobacterium sp. DSM 109958]NMN00856.1 hypothetical protein [Bifidobacterium sp. DSM 109958]
MARRASRGRHGVRRSWLASVAVVLILAMTGWLLAVNVRLNRTAYYATDTAGMVEEQVSRMERLSGEVNDLSSQIDALKVLVDDGSGSSSSSGTDADSGLNTMLSALSGPGVTVTLDDSPLREQAANDPQHVDAYVIHQQDIEAVVNALWAGGAEAMMIMDQRVRPTTAVRCVGNTLLLEDKKYAPPYTVSAIGGAQSMLSALDSSDAIRIYKDYVKVYGLGWKVQTVDRLDFPKATLQTSQLKYAAVIPSDTGAAASASPSDGASDNASAGAASGATPSDGATPSASASQDTASQDTTDGKDR